MKPAIKLNTARSGLSRKFQSLGLALIFLSTGVLCFLTTSTYPPSMITLAYASPPPPPPACPNQCNYGDQVPQCVDQANNVAYDKESVNYLSAHVESLTLNIAEADRTLAVQDAAINALNSAIALNQTTRNTILTMAKCYSLNPPTNVNIANRIIGGTGNQYPCNIIFTEDQEGVQVDIFDKENLVPLIGNYTCGTFTCDKYKKTICTNPTVTATYNTYKLMYTNVCGNVGATTQTFVVNPSSPNYKPSCFNPNLNLANQVGAVVQGQLDVRDALQADYDALAEERFLQAGYLNVAIQDRNDANAALTMHEAALISCESAAFPLNNGQIQKVCPCQSS